jgi:hypothetical protein
LLAKKLFILAVGETYYERKKVKGKILFHFYVVMLRLTIYGDFCEVYFCYKIVYISSALT